jgi:SRSO17 transposase
VTTTKSRAAAAARIGAGLGRRKRTELLGLLRPCFVRVEPWLQAGKYAAALMSELPRRNGWTIAEHAGDRAPDKTQRLLNRAVWDTAAVGVVREFAVAGLGQAARGRGLVVGAVDETGQVKQGERTAGVKRHYLGCAGKVANGITTVHLAYVRERAGHALIAARQWIPREHIGDPAQAVATGLPPGLVFRTKGQLAIDLLTEVFAGGVQLDFVCGDAVGRSLRVGVVSGVMTGERDGERGNGGSGFPPGCGWAAEHVCAGAGRGRRRAAAGGPGGCSWRGA